MSNAKWQMLNGQSLFEVVLALAISMLIVVALVALTSSAIRNTTFSKNKTQATRLSQEATEWLRGERDADWTIFYNRAANPLYCLKSLSWSEATIGACTAGQEIANTIFKRELGFARSVVMVDGQPRNVVEAEVNVYWQDGQGLHEIRSVTDFTDWREAS
jgi:ABC-type transport system involved in cytochrome bd biosynthesis fused ATPase/permease subunit